MINKVITLFKRITSHPQYLYWYAVAVLLLPNVALCFTEGMTLWACVANVLLPLGLYMWLMAFSAKPGKMVWVLFPLIFFAAFQMVLIYLFGQGVIAVDMFLNVVTSNPCEIFELLDNLIPAVMGVFVIYLPLLAWGVLSARSRTRVEWPLRRYRYWGAWVALGGLVCICVANLNDSRYRLRDHLYPANVVYNLGLAVQRSWISAHYEESSADFRFHSRMTHPADSMEAYVMVIGETARAHNFGLYGYSRNTTPLMGSAEGVTAFRHATTQSNTTHKSVPMLLSAATADHYDRLYHERGVLAAFREAGYYTVFISNQLQNHSFVDFLGRQADSTIYVKAMFPSGTNVHDGAMLSMVKDVLAQRRNKVLIVLHTYGSHFDYSERYPRQMAHFLPDKPTEARYENRVSLVNAYDNSIRYTDWLLYRLTLLLSEYGGQSAMAYTSDHGENIFDDQRRLFLHASPQASEYELRVPFIVWQSDAYRRAYPAVGKALQANKNRAVQTSASFFHTILNLAGLDTPCYDATLSVASPAYRERPLQYLTDHNEPMPISLQEHGSVHP